MQTETIRRNFKTSLSQSYSSRPKESERSICSIWSNHGQVCHFQVKTSIISTVTTSGPLK